MEQQQGGISGAAVEAAARVLALNSNSWTPDDWDSDFGVDPDDPEGSWKDHYRGVAREALVAASPHLYKQEAGK